MLCVASATPSTSPAILPPRKTFVASARIDFGIWLGIAAKCSRAIAIGLLLILPPPRSARVSHTARPISADRGISKLHLAQYCEAIDEWVMRRIVIRNR
jgi:hypothetical protein